MKRSLDTSSDNNTANTNDKVKNSNSNQDDSSSPALKLQRITMSNNQVEQMEAMATSEG